MRRRNREILIFSLSAIDLFCAGMGAVMVLMVLLMPYYQRPPEAAVPEEPKPVAVKPDPPAPPPDPAPEPVLEPEPVPEPGLRVRAIDVVFVMDATASMEDELQSVKDSMTAIVQVLRRISDEVHVGFVAYIDRDVPWALPPLSVSKGVAGDRNLRRVLRVIEDVELVGNRDWPEDVCGGLRKATLLPWPPLTDERRQVIVVIGDAMTHWEDRAESLAIAREWVEGTANRGIHAVNTFLEVLDRLTFRETQTYFKAIAEAGRGEYFEEQGSLLGAILDILIER